MKLILCASSVHAILLLFIILPIYISFAYASSNETDRLTLLAFKKDIKDDPNQVLSSWNNSLHFCQWEGVTCGSRHQRVTLLILQNQRLTGTISSHIGNLSFLRKIYLPDNNFQGKIPHEIGRLFRLDALSLTNNSLTGEIPANLWNCSNLKLLHLSNNSLVGNLPEEVGHLSKLEVLSIYLNNLIGLIPPSLGNLSSLHFLSASTNKFVGRIPNTLGQLRSLTFLGFADNKLSGLTPSSIYNLSLLTDIVLSVNQFEGTLPSDIGLTLPNLRYLSIFDNQFAGSIPFSLSNASKLEWLNLINNSFTGKLSVDFGGLPHLLVLNLPYNNLGTGEADDLNFLKSMTNCTKLQLFDLLENQFGGFLPDSIGNMSRQLNRFGVAANQISGTIPPGIENLVGLSVLYLVWNQFTGNIPHGIGKLQNLQRVAFASNRFSGEIPSSFGNLSNLNILDMRQNQLHGRIPSSLGQCKNLIFLELSRNNLNGSIPKEIFQIFTLSINLNLSQNQLTGNLPPEVGKLTNIQKLDLSANRLSGELSSSLSGCIALERLYLHKNFFNGSIPSSFSSLRGIQYLDLSQNNLTGKIPKFLESIPFRNLNLSSNDFEGEIPIQGVFKNKTVISVVGNKRLCGGVPELEFPRCATEASKKNKLSLVEKLIISIACGLVGIALVSSVIWRKRRSRGQSAESSIKGNILRISYEMLHKATDGFSSANVLGTGAFGTVYRGNLDQYGMIIAVKVFNLQHHRSSKSFMAECEALRNIRHRNLVRVLSCCSSIDFQGNDFKALVYEYMPNGNLDTLLHPSLDAQNESGYLNLLQRLNIAIDVASALDYLHHHCQTPIIHCDLKPSNVLLDDHMTAHLGDFGLARILSESSVHFETSSIGIKGTVGYAAPEYGMGSEASKYGDVYSYGILLLEMFTGQRPTNDRFKDNLGLHYFVKMAMPEQVLKIADPVLLQEDENRARNCLVSIFRVGVACSVDIARERMDIANVLAELISARSIMN